LLGRFFFFYVLLQGRGTGLVQSVVIGGVCVLIAVQMFVLGILADLLSANRTLIEDLLSRVRRLELSKHKQDVADDDQDNQHKMRHSG
jgi:hypothetical protein